MDKKTTGKGGMGFVSTLTLIFVVLRISGLVDWPWVWVFSPVWISLLALGLAFGVILLAGRIKKSKW